MDVVMREKGQLTLPADVREELRADAGSCFRVSVRPGQVVLTLIGNENGNGGQSVDELPAEWAARIDRSIAELDARLGRVFESEDEFFAFLDE